MDRFMTPTSSTTPNEITSSSRSSRQITKHASALRVKLCDAFASVIAHGAYPLSMLDNPAIRALLLQLQVVSIDDIDAIPSRRTITRKVDDMLDTEDKDLMAFVLASLGKKKWCLAFDEWESAAKIAFMSISIHFIQADWSGMFNFPIACHEFAHPHDMVDIKDHIIGVLKEKTNLNHPEVVARLGSLTYDGAKVN
jgi:hypothetical protein